MSFCNGFIGIRPNSNLPFAGGDTEEFYKKNLKSQSSYWYYRNHEITYKKNENGHRSKSIDDLDLNNYILFTGCSYTEGTGVELEKTYPYLVSKELNYDYYNLAVAGSGPDTCFFNLVQFYSKVKKLPKFLILQMPENSRFVTLNKNAPEEPFTFYSIWEDKAKTFILEGESLDYFANKTQLFESLIEQLYTCPIIRVLSPNTNNTESNGCKITFKDNSRDFAHPGNFSNEHLAFQIKALIQNHDKYTNATVHSTFRG